MVYPCYFNSTAYGGYVGEFEQWKEDVLWQARKRKDQPLICRLHDELGQQIKSVKYIK